MILASILLIATATQDLPSVDVAPTVRPITADERKALEGAVRDQVSDPTAVRFRMPAKMTVDGHYCGLVNGKSVYGEYVGYTPFHARLTHEADGTITISEIVIGTDTNTSAAIESACARIGLGLGLARDLQPDDDGSPLPLLLPYDRGAPKGMP